MVQAITDEQIGRIHRRTSEVVRRAIEGTISFEPTMDALQEIVEGRREPKPRVERSMRQCQVFNSCHCTICAGFFADGDTVCANGHEIGKSYPVLR